MLKKKQYEKLLESNQKLINKLKQNQETQNKYFAPIKKGNLYKSAWLGK